MPSPPPLGYDAYYHIYNRGTNRDNIFIEKRNYQYFLELYLKHVVPVAFTYAYCLMRNHFYLLIRTKSTQEQEQTFRVSETQKVFKPKSPSQAFSNLFNAYAKSINKAYDRTGSLFEHPFCRVQINSNAQLVNLVAYIHFNQQKHGFVDDYRDWPHSSFHALKLNDETWLRRDELIGWFGSQEQFEEYHCDYQDDFEIKDFE